MKKYLINGVLALFAGIYLASCADTETDYVPIAEQKAKAFKEVFKEVYGEIDPHQNWGFTTDLTLADLSTAEIVYLDSVVEQQAQSTTRRALTRTANPDANMWGRTYTNIPETLTVAQKLRARLYFQYNRYPVNDPVDYTNFFVQDVYKGATTPLNDGTAAMSQYSTEQYSFNNQQVVGSAHMDYLTAGPNNDHIYNYNNATCSTNENVWDGKTYEAGWPIKDENEARERNVGDWEAENYNHIVFHSDKIMLMENSSTECFGWHDSQGSIHHNDQYVIVSGDSIDAWATRFAEDHPNINLGESVSGRGFVGFDYEANVDVSQFYIYEWVDLGNGVWGPSSEPKKTPDGVYYVSPNVLNMASCTVVPANTPGAHPVDGRYVEGSNNTVNIWVVLGCADGYYSDWIVCIVPAQGKTITSREKVEKYGVVYKIPVEPQCGRIFCEDLGVSTREDLDYNDVVFDVDVYQNYEAGTKYYYTIYSDGRKVLDRTEEYSTQRTYSAKITLQAAGGTLPLTVIGKEVHEMFGVGVTTMVNTRDDNSTAFGSYVNGKSPVDLGEYTTSQLFPGKQDTEEILAKDIPIVVNYNTAKEVAILSAEKGDAPAKLFVPNHSTKWTVERKPLVIAYPKFANYVNNVNNGEWWKDDVQSTSATDLVEYYRYNNTTYRPIVTPPVVITRITYPAVSQDNLWTGSRVYTAWGVENIPLSLPAGRNQFYAGDYITFYGENLKDDSYITVVFGDGTKPYFIDTRFLNYDVDSQGNMTTKLSGVIEVKLDKANAEKLNNSYINGQLAIQVQGRNFTLTRIGRTLFQ